MTKDIKIVGEKENFDIESEFSGASQIITLSKRIGIPLSNYKTANRNTVLANGCVPPPYNPRDIISYKKLDSTYQACLEVKANTIVGLGYEIRSNKLTNKSQLVKLLEQPNSHIGETFTAMMKAMFIDLDTFYNGYIEFIRYGKTRALYYAPAKDIYVKPKFINGNATREIDKYYRIEGWGITGEYLPYPADGKTKDGVSYLLHFKRNSQDNIYYGSPDYSHLHDLIKQSYLSDQYNINFFSNGGQPSWAVLVTGGKLSKRGQEAIQEYLNNDMKGVANAHKMLFLSFQSEKAQVKLVPLSKSIDEQFITLNEKVRFQITLKCHVMPKMVGISQGGNFGGGSAGVADMQTYIETVSRPEQQYIEDVLNQFFSLEFGVNPELVFNSMDISNEKDDAIIANLYWNMVDEHGNKVLDVNEVRTRYLHLKPIDLVHTSENEEKLDDTMSVNAQGRPRSSSGNMDAGERGDINNLNPEKNKR